MPVFRARFFPDLIFYLNDVTDAPIVDSANQSSQFKCVDINVSLPNKIRSELEIAPRLRLTSISVSQKRLHEKLELPKKLSKIHLMPLFVF